MQNSFHALPLMAKYVVDLLVLWEAACQVALRKVKTCLVALWHLVWNVCGGRKKSRSVTRLGPTSRIFFPRVHALTSWWPFQKELKMERSFTGDRTKQDMSQAHMMARRLTSHQPPQAAARSAESPQTQQNIWLGFHGLKEAETLEEKRQNEGALRLYELSIDLLLKCLRNTPIEDTQQLISQRVTVALSKAEALKERSQQSMTGFSPFSSQSSQESSSEKGGWEELASSLYMAIHSVSPTSAAAASTKTHRRKTSKTSPTSKKATTTDRISPTANSQNNTSPAAAGPRRSRLDYDKNPLVQAVKNDLYVDSKELAKTTWKDIAGLSRAKQLLQESAILPLVRPDLFQGLRKPQNILLYGPPGTGKTMLVKAVAHESKCLLFACSPSTLTSKWHGEGEKLVRTLFAVAHDVAPSIIFVDELDALLSTRSDGEHEASRRFKTEFMVQMDGVSPNQNHVLVVGCTNCPWNVDDAILRRFPRRILIPLPDREARTEMLRQLLNKAGKHSIRSPAKLAQRLDGYSGSDIASIASEASFGPLRSLGGLEAIQKVREDQLRPISEGDFSQAIARTNKSVSPALLQRYDAWERQQAAK